MPGKCSTHGEWTGTQKRCPPCGHAAYERNVSTGKQAQYDANAAERRLDPNHRAKLATRARRYYAENAEVWRPRQAEYQKAKERPSGCPHQQWRED